MDDRNAGCDARISADASGLPGPGFNTRPSQDWCYFYEKSELAHQLGDWPRAADLGDQAQSAGYRPNQSPSDSAREWLAFLEAYARTSRAGTARDLTLQAYQSDPKSAALLCAVWQGLPGVSGPEYDEVQSGLNCPPGTH